jgi:hypothetical protein
VPELGSVEEELEETVEVASGALIFEADGVALVAGEFREGKGVCAAAGQTLPEGLYVALLLTGEQLLGRVEHIVEHYQRFIHAISFKLCLTTDLSINS